MDRTGDWLAAVRRFEALGRAARAEPAGGGEPGVGGGAAARRAAGAGGNQAFVKGSLAILNELETLQAQVREFVGSSATQRRLFEDSGMALAKSSEGIKRKLDTVAKAVQGLERVAEGQGSKQLRAHYAVVLETLKKRFAELTKRFQSTLQERTKDLSIRQAEQVKRFGANKVQLSSAPPAVALYNPALAASMSGASAAGSSSTAASAGLIAAPRAGAQGAPGAIPTPRAGGAAQWAAGAPIAAPLAPAPHQQLQHQNQPYHPSLPSQQQQHPQLAPPRPAPLGMSAVAQPASAPSGNTTLPISPPGGMRRRGMLPMPAPSLGSGGSVAGPIHGSAPAAMPAFNPFGQQPAPAGNKKDDDYAVAADGERQAAQYARQTFAQRRRAVDMQNVESTISELSQMFGKVASLVAEQGEVVNRIDDDMDVAGLNVQAGQNELLKYYSNLSGERQLIIKLLLVTCCLGAFFIYWWR
jgi:hypothetical protein